MKTLPEGRVHHCVVRPDENEVYWGGGGTIWYQPPECLLANTKPNVKVPLTDKVSKSRPFGKFCNKSSLSERLYKEAKSGVKFPQTYKVSEDCKVCLFLVSDLQKLIQSFLSVDPNDRPSIEEALNCPIFYFE
uniref:Protein kinase, putative n=1 Tax=Theileria annulata TaxID=5874 RepID=A0A3B0NEY2_THEAN